MTEMTKMATEVTGKSRFFEGGNGVAIIAIPIALLLCLIFYGKVSAFISPLNIKVDDLYKYVFDIFAIEFGALLALFALLACKPTPFLERIKNTQTFAAIMTTTKITMTISTVVIIVTFAFGISHLEPESTLTLRSVLFLMWSALAASTTCFYASTVRLIFTALA
jgi:hypothetical protein